MKKIVLFLLLILPVFNFASIKDIPEGYMYVGLQIDDAKFNDILKKTLTPQVLTIVTQQAKTWMQNEIGFDFLKDSVTSLGINANEYIEFCFKPESQKEIYIVVPADKPAAFIEHFKKILKKKWTGLNEEKAGQNIKKIFTKNPKYSKDFVFYMIQDKKVYLSPSDETLASLEKLPKEKSEAFLSSVEKTMQTEKPFFVFYLSQNLINQLTTAQFNYGGAVLLNSKKNEIVIDIIANEKNKNLKAKIPSFIEDNPLMLVNIPLDREALLKLAEKSQDQQILSMINLLNLKDSIGDNAFLSLQDLNYLEIMQGNMMNTRALIGLEIKDNKPYLALFDSMVQGAAAGETKKDPQQEMNKASKTLYQGNPIYSVQDLNMGGVKEMYIAVLKNYVLVGFNQESLKKAIDLSSQKKKKVILPVDDKNLVLFMNIVKFFQKVPVAMMLQQQGIAADNFKYIVGRLMNEQADDFLRLHLSIIFNR